MANAALLNIADAQYRQVSKSYFNSLTDFNKAGVSSIPEDTTRLVKLMQHELILAKGGIQKYTRLDHYRRHGWPGYSRSYTVDVFLQAETV